jgi:hypothetical protein
MVWDPRFLRPVRKPFRHIRVEAPQAMPQAAGRGGRGQLRRAASRRALRRSSSRTTFGRGTGFGRAATRTR